MPDWTISLQKPSLFLEHLGAFRRRRLGEDSDFVHSETRPPALAIWLLRAAAGLAPQAERQAWRDLWITRLENLWVLAERGELPAHAPAETARLCHDAISRAFWMRFERPRVLHWMQGPAFVLTLAGAALVLLGILSRGFQGTRSVINTAIEWKIEPRAMRYDPRADLVVATFLPILLAITVGVILMLIGRSSLGRYGWKYWLYLAGKIASIMAILPLVWIEGNAALRAHIVTVNLALVFGWLAWTLAFLGAFGGGVIWSFADQRRRCPVCLGKLAMPVTLGSWASMFEPVTTEMLCDEGHGTLTMDESEIGAGDRWITLDSSWRGL
jgi:hypothetical protein